LTGRSLHCLCKQKFLQRCDDCADEKHCCVRLIMLEARNAIATVLDNRTLAEMRALSEIDEEEESLMYCI